MTEENLTIVLHGFFNLTMKEKLRLVEEMNNYFDATEREPVRGAWEAKFAAIDWNEPEKKCCCCGR
jgi:hypothetical protein